MPLPGDDLVANPALESTRAITIQAPASTIWPWLVQLGQGRGGFYSYQRLENLIGSDIHNADSIVPEYQDLKVGDQVRISREGPAFEVAAVERDSTLILRGDMPNEEGKPVSDLGLFLESCRRTDNPTDPPDPFRLRVKLRQ